MKSIIFVISYLQMIDDSDATTKLKHLTSKQPS